MADLTDRFARLSPAGRAALERALLARRDAARRAAGIPHRPDGEAAPLSFAQRGFFFADQFAGGVSGLYGPHAVVRLTGQLDVPAMRRAFAEVVARHEILRTTFAHRDGQPVQLVRPHAAPAIPVVDLTGLAPAGRNAATAAAVTGLLRPYDLANGPLLRVGLLRTGAREHLLLVALHHIVADGWSYALLTDEVSALYTAIRAGRAPAAAGLPDLPVSYADFACWQRSPFDEDGSDDGTAWWCEHHAGAPPVLSLPADRPRPATPGYRGERVRAVVPARVADALRALSRDAGATLFMTLLAAFDVVVARNSGTSDVVVGTTVGGRTHGDLERLIGCFVNTLALRADLSGEPTFRELLARVRTTTLAALARQDVPFDRLVDRLRVPRSTRHTPVFQVMFQLQNMPPASWELAGLEARPLPPGTTTEPFDLTMEVTETGAELAVHLSYRTDLFDRGTAERLLGHFTTLLAGVAETPGARVSELAMLTPAESHRLLVAWQSPRSVPAVSTAGAAVPIGRPVANTRAYVLDDDLRPVPVGVVGELCLAGAQVGRGYVGQPGRTAEKFVPDPFGDGGRLYRTGDLARWLPGGELEFVGRRDRQVKVRGHRIELGEIEAVLHAHPEVHAAAVVRHAPAEDDVRLVAHVVGRRGPVAQEALRAFLGERLPAHMVPATFLPIAELPRTASGKVEHAALPAPQPRPEAGASSARPAHEPFVELLHDIWREVLRSDQVGPDTDFFLAGGHSLLALRVMARIRDRLGVELPVRALFDAPTPAGFARLLPGAAPTGAAAGIPVTDLTGPAPASHAQRRMWFTHQLDPTGHASNVTTVLDVGGLLDVAALRRALGVVCTRHEPLRTTFRQDGDEVVQLVGPPGAVELPVVDLAGLDDGPACTVAEQLADGHARTRFDLARGPLLRALLIRLGPDRNQVVVTLHHIITDAWSTGLLLAELWECYAAARRGERPPPASLPVRYTDFARWERDRVARGELSALADHWRSRLAGAPAHLDLEADHPRPAGPVFQGATLPFALTEEQTAELVAFSRRAGVTVFMTVLAAYLVLIRSRTGAADIVVGADAANRDRVELERMVGFFTNQIVLRIGIDGQDTVAALLAAVRETTLEAYAHQEMPFDRLVELLAPERRADRAPVFQGEITFQRTGDAPPVPDGLTVGVRELYGDTSTMDVSLHVVHAGPVVRGGLAYNADIFAASTARRMLDTVLMVLAALPTGTGSTVDEVVARVERRRAELSAQRWAATARDLFDRMPALSTAPLSPQQRQLPAGADARSRCEIRMRGPVRADVLDVALAAVVRRHAELRTELAAPAGAEQPTQVIADTAAHCLRVAGDQDEPERLTGRPDAALRATLTRHAPERHTLVLTVPAALADTVGMGVLAADVAGAYGTGAYGTGAYGTGAYGTGAYGTAEDRPDPDPGTYGRYAAWQRAVLTDDTLAVTRRVAATARAGRLPFEPPEATPVTATRTLPGAVLDGVRVPEEELLFVCWQVLLWRQTGDADVVVGAVLDGRAFAELATVIGPCAKVLPVLSHLTAGDRLADVVARAHRALTVGREEQPGHPAVPADPPVWEFEYAVAPTLPLSWTVTDQAGPPPGAGLRLHCLRGADGLRVTLAGDRATPQFAACLLDQFAALVTDAAAPLTQAAARPDRTVGTLRTVSEPAARRLSAGLNRTGVERSHGLCAFHLVQERAAATPDRVAVAADDGSLTYAELNAAANRLARHLRPLGAGPETRVGLCVERGVDMVVALLAVHKAGAAYVPIDPLYPAERIAAIVADTALPILVTSGATARHVDVPVTVDLARDRDRIAAHDGGDLGLPVDAEQLAYVLHTSGSTGRPKGVEVPHGALVNFLRSMAGEPGITARDTLVAVTTLSFDIAALELYLPLAYGARVRVASRATAADPDALARLLDVAGATLLQATPVTWRLLLDSGWPGRPDLTALVGGEALPPDLVRRLRPRVAGLWNMYGPTETTVWSTCADLSDPATALTAGRPIANTCVHVLDDAGRPVAVGMIGEVYLGGDGVARGYAGSPGPTAERFVPDHLCDRPGARMYRTGDLARIDPCGRLHVLGRADGQVKIRGFRIELGEVEAALGRHPEVVAAVVTTRPDDGGGLRLEAHVVPAPGSTPRPDELRAHLRTRLPAPMVPARLAVVGTLPLTANGKVDRGALPPLAADTGSAEHVPAGTDLERIIAGVWRTVLDVERVGLTDNFFDLGGHSVLLVRLSGLLRSELDRDITPLTLLEHPTVAALARHLRAGDESPTQDPDDIARGRARLLRRRRTTR